MKNILKLFILQFLFSCSQGGGDNKADKDSATIKRNDLLRDTANYKIELLYDDQLQKDGSKLLSKNELHIFFESGFNGEIVRLYSNNLLVAKQRLVTNASVGEAGYIHLKISDSLKSISFNIDNGKMCTLSVDKTRNIIQVNFNNGVLDVFVTNEAKTYD